MHSSATLEVIHLFIQPGQEITQHSNPFDVVVCVVQGEVILNTGDNQTRLSIYDVAEISKNTERGFTNNGTSESRMLILKKL